MDVLRVVKRGLTRAPKFAAIAHGYHANPDLDVHDRGGRIIPNLVFTNFYLGGSASWKAADIAAIDGALAGAMSDTHLNNVMVQYFRGDQITSEFRPSRILPGAPPKHLYEKNLESRIKKMYTAGDLKGYPLPSTVFVFLAPLGTILHLGDDSSLEGMAGFHSAVPIGKKRIYYAVAAFSKGKNGIAIFKQPWKNVVATLYHELNEARTDPDVYDAGKTGNDSYLGWTNDELPGEEIGDVPIIGKNLKSVIREVALAHGGGTVPIQLMWSNYVHGPEGPVAQPRPVTT